MRLFTLALLEGISFITAAPRLSLKPFKQTGPALSAIISLIEDKKHDYCNKKNFSQLETLKRTTGSLSNFDCL